MDLATLSAITVIIGFICTAFNYIVIAPLRASIETLRISIDKLSAGLEDIREKQHAIKVQIAEIEALPQAVNNGLWLTIDKAHVMTHGEAADNEDGEYLNLMSGMTLNITILLEAMSNGLCKSNQM